MTYYRMVSFTVTVGGVVDYDQPMNDTFPKIHLMLISRFRSVSYRQREGFFQKYIYFLTYVLNSERNRTPFVVPIPSSNVTTATTVTVRNPFDKSLRPPMFYKYPTLS